MNAVRTRFAPSPTGDLHLGNARIAVFNWLFARHCDGRFVLRIEDTDVERTVPGSEEGIREDLHWLGIEWDEGPERGGPVGPYRQSERQALYRETARRLMSEGAAYPCYCTAEELEAERTAGGMRGVLRYSGRCRELGEGERLRFESEGRTPSLRFASPRDGTVDFEDEVRGVISLSANEIDDFVILRADGRPTYNFAVVVDDTAMEISHVIRGAGHLSNTPKQALLYDALGQPRPRFVHLPTVLSPDGGKLSKREGGASLRELREAGYHPEGVVNYLSLLGWSSPDEEEMLTSADLVRRIGLERVGTSDTIYDPEKLRWLSGRHMARMSLTDLADAAEPYLDRKRFPLDREELERALAVLRSRLTTFGELNEHLSLLWPAPPSLEKARVERPGAEDGALRRFLASVAEEIDATEPWEPEVITAAVRAAGAAAGRRGRDLFHPVRLALTGAASGPDLGGVIWAIGRAEAVYRLRAAARL